ncbi:hypothetical protein BC831DRAFT_450465 [Entophlyctis helioformis]|nr:hypothetical protein BC831DRAFT_450465 [Entophlyctis helioformis]
MQRLWQLHAWRARVWLSMTLTASCGCPLLHGGVSEIVASGGRLADMQSVVVEQRPCDHLLRMSQRAVSRRST